jgi:hypothetical protein
LVASKLNISSSSSGSGDNRYTIMYRTKSTVSFDEPTLERAMRVVKRPFFPRKDVEPDVARQAASKLSQSNRGGDPGCRHGDVVGQHASEIGQENKGRVLLEKMGWSKGMALGACNNGGITVPIAQVIKKGKGGLGEL